MQKGKKRDRISTRKIISNYTEYSTRAEESDRKGQYLSGASFHLQAAVDADQLGNRSWVEKHITLAERDLHYAVKKEKKLDTLPYNDVYDSLRDILLKRKIDYGLPIAFFIFGVLLLVAGLFQSNLVGILIFTSLLSIIFILISIEFKRRV